MIMADATHSTFAIGGIACAEESFVGYRKFSSPDELCAEKPAHRS